MDVSPCRLALYLSSAVLLSATGCGPSYKSPGANVILISIDTLRADHLSLYGYARETSPHLGAFARDAVVFDSFTYNGGGTLPSHLAMMTSLRPSTHGIHPGNPRALGDERTTLAEVLAPAGYRTTAFVDGGWLRGKFGFRQGFDHYDDLGGDPVTGRFKNILPKTYAWLDDHYLERFFLFIHTYDVHSQGAQRPYDCPGDYAERYVAGHDVTFDGCREGRCASTLLGWLNAQHRKGDFDSADFFTPAELDYIVGLYDGCINYVDDQLQVLFDRLRELDVYDESLIVVTSDHGEEFLEHGMFIHDSGTFEELAHLPLIVKLPNSRFGGRRVPHLAAMIDVMPTLLDVLDLVVPDEAQGQSLMPTVVDDVPVRDEVLMYDTLKTRRWKYFLHQRLLFDLEQDLGEQVNLHSAKADVVDRLEKKTRRLLFRDSQLKEQLSLASSQEDVELTAEEVRTLKALGYLSSED